METHFKPKHYHRPGKIETITQLLSQEGARIIAGGTDLFVNKTPEILSLIDITDLGLDYVKQHDEYVAIGTTTSFSQIIASPYLEEQPLSIIKDSAWEIGHYNLRHIATIGGNICNAVPSADSPIALIALDAIAVIEGPLGERLVPLDGFFTLIHRLLFNKIMEFSKSIPVVFLNFRNLCK